MICENCKLDLSLENFYKLKNGYRQPCKKCRAELAKQKYVNITEKKCGCCGKIKQVSEFGFSKDYGYQSFCKECKKIYYSKSKKYEPQQIGMKVCSCCGKKKDIKEFSINKNSKDGRMNRCKQCIASYDISRIFDIQTTGTKFCPRCQQELPIDNFAIARRNPTGRFYCCRSCSAKYKSEIIDKFCIYCGKPFKGRREIDYACPSCKFHSQPEHELICLLNKYNIKYQSEFNLNNYWYDFYLPDYNLLIDISPTASHSSYTTIPYFTPKDCDYHYDRLLVAQQNNYKYINIWAWNNQENIIKAIKEHTLQILQGKVQKHWGKDKTDKHIQDNNFDEEQMIAEGWRPIYDDGQMLIY